MKRRKRLPVSKGTSHREISDGPGNCPCRITCFSRWVQPERSGCAKVVWPHLQQVCPRQVMRVCLAGMLKRLAQTTHAEQKVLLYKMLSLPISRSKQRGIWSNLKNLIHSIPPTNWDIPGSEIIIYRAAQAQAGQAWLLEPCPRPALCDAKSIVKHLSTSFLRLD